MKKINIIKPVIFCIIFLILLQTITYIIRTDGDVKNRFVGFYAEKKDSIDVIFIGSSPVHPYYCAPKLFGEYGIASYPMSSYQQRPKAATYIMDEVLKTQKPKVWIFEMRQYLAEESAMTDNMAHTRGLTDNLKYSWNRVELINALVDKKEERYTYYFDIFKYHSNWKTMVLPRQLSCFRYEKLDPWKGFLYIDEIQPALYNDVTNVTDKIAIPQDKEDSLQELLKYLKEHDMEAIFIVSPYQLTEEAQMKYNYIEEIVSEQGYDFVNMNKKCDGLNLDFENSFYDGGNHANIYGADACTDYLGQYLLEHYELLDRREDDDYSSWQDAYRLWRDSFEESKDAI